MSDMEKVSRAIEELSGSQLRKAMYFLTEMHHVYRKDLLEDQDRYRGRDQQRRFSRWMKRDGFPNELRESLIAIGRAIYYSNSE
jgi:hypothetical protein